jgi:hypothetical protein
MRGEQASHHTIEWTVAEAEPRAAAVGSTDDRRLGPSRSEAMKVADVGFSPRD